MIARRLVVLMIMVGSGLVFNPVGSQAQVPSENRADLQNQAAEDWFKLADSGKYEESWNTASSEAKSQTTSGQWQSAVSAQRSSLGNRLTRGLDSRNEVTTLTGWPAGEYAVLTFSSSFANRAHAVEKLTLKKDADGTWRAAVYSIE